MRPQLTRSFVLFLLVAACAGPETGLDTTVLIGTVSIPPALVEEKDNAAAPNDTAAQALGEDGSTSLTYRAVVLTGSTSAWTPETGQPGTDDDEIYGDADLYAFSPIADGTFTITLDFATGADAETGGDAVVYDFYVVEAASLDLAYDVGYWSTDGSAGAVTLQADLVAGGDYVLVVGGYTNTEGDAEVPYQVSLSGSQPAAGVVLVGAYLESDPAVASDPVGGTSVTSWAYDAETLTYTGPYEILYLRSVVMDGATDTSDGSPVVDEGLTDPIYLMAGTLSGLNATPSAGALYSSVSVEVQATSDASEVASAIVLDALFPKVIGVESVEGADDTVVEIDAEYKLNGDTVVAQDVGALSGIGFVDTFDGFLALSGGVGWEANDADAYAFTLVEPASVIMTGSWGNASSDLDFGIWGYVDGTGWVDWFSNFSSYESYCLYASNPEICTTVVPLDPDVTYYLIALGYSGDAGDEPYHIELEWIP